MNERKTFEYEIRAVLEENAPMLPPNHLLQSFEFNARRSRRFPRWLALIKEPSMRTDSHLAVGSPTARVAAILAATLLLAGSLTAIGVAGSGLLAADGTIVVDADGGSDYTTIQDAVASAEDGDEILVKPATYTGPIDIDKDITLRGEDREGVIVEYGVGCAPTDEDDFMLPETCPDETLLYDGFWFGDSPYGLLLLDSKAEVSDLTVRKSPTTEGSGIVINGGAPNVSRVTFADVDGFGNLYVHGGSAAHIDDSDLGEAWVFFEERSPATIENSTFGAIVANTDNTSGRGGPSTIRNNTTRGIAFNGQASVEGNTLVAPNDELWENDFYGQGIDVQRGDGWIIRGNTIEGFSEATGIDVLAGGTGTISGNTLSGNSLALGLGSGSHVVEGNIISGGRTGISTTGGEAQLTGNVIEGVSNRGMAIGAVSRPVLKDNRSCGNGENLWVAESAMPVIDDTNEICEDAPAE